MSQTPTNQIDGSLDGPARPKDFEALLARVRARDIDAVNDLIALAHGDLRRLAAGLMRSQPADHTLQATALVSEACLRLMKSKESWNDRAHFLRFAGTTMRNLLVDHARSKSTRITRGQSFDLDHLVTAFEVRSAALPELDAALERLAEMDEQAAHLIDLRFFGGASMRECAEVLNLHERATERKWVQARARLRFILAETS